MTKVGAMKQLKVGKSAIGKEFWQATSFDAAQRRRKGGCIGGRINEENARFALLAFCLLVYMIFGATVFHFLESANEEREKQRYFKKLSLFKRNYCSHFYINCTLLDDLLDHRGNMSAAGYMTGGTSKWDFPGAFHFVGTIVSTIGFGTTAPRTTYGRLFTIFYGFFGCAAGILFFNLFLERIITGIAYFIRFLHDRNPIRRLLKRGPTIRGVADRRPRRAPEMHIQPQDSDDAQSEVSVPDWKPPVQKVFGVLLFLAVMLILVAASVYQWAEQWSYLDALYFCFSSFATIGFGDFVPDQSDDNPNPIYPMTNACFLIFGCCFVYSLFNVTSILIRQFLNKIIRSLNCQCKCPNKCRKKRQRYLGLGLRPPDPDDISDTERPQDGIISLKEFLEQNKMNIFLMQKHLVESSQHEREVQAAAANSISAASVGPLAILSRQFGED